MSVFLGCGSPSPDDISLEIMLADTNTGGVDRSRERDIRLTRSSNVVLAPWPATPPGTFIFIFAGAGLAVRELACDFDFTFGISDIN